MLLVPVSSYEDMYEINILFHNRKSYFDLKPHNIFLRCLFMTQNEKIRQMLSYFHKSVTKLISDIFEDQWEESVPDETSLKSPECAPYRTSSNITSSYEAAGAWEVKGLIAVSPVWP